MFEKIAGIVCIAFALLLSVGLAALIWTSVEEERKYDEWAKQCNDAGYVIVDTGHYSHCMSWEEAKEKGVEFEVG